MKKKIISILLGGLTVVSLASCSGIQVEKQSGQDESTVASAADTGDQTGADTLNQNDTNADQDQANTGAEDGDKTKETDGTDLGSLSGDAKTSGKSYLLGNWYTDKTIYIMDGNGSILSSFDREEVIKKVRELERGVDLSNASMEGVSDNVVFFTFYEYDGDGNHCNLFAVDLKTFEAKSIWISKDNEYDNGLEVYDGKIYLSASRSEEGKSIPMDFVFTKTPGSFDYTMEELDLSKIKQAAGDHYIRTGSTNEISTYERLPISLCLDRYGFITVEEDDKLVKIDNDGNTEELMLTGSSPNIMDFDGEYIIYQEDISDSTSNICSYNLKDKTCKVIWKNKDNVYMEAYEKGKAYLVEDKGTEFSVEDTVVYQLDVATGEQRTLYECKDVPGVDIMAGMSDWSIKGDQIYFKTFDQNTIKWVTIDPNATSLALTDVGCAGEEISTFKYGKVEYKTATSKCSKCGTYLNKMYAETFLLDSKYSDRADMINDNLNKALLTSVENLPETQDTSDDVCEGHKEYPESYCETEEYRISGVEILSDKYLIVNESGYWYGGGAHGMPIRNQNVFDLETGKEMTLKDFYTGSEKDFKELIAQKTKEDFFSQTYSPYFSDNAEDIYSSAYEYAELETSSVEFTKEGAYLIYPPYMMGPYASGYIEVFISYDELLGRPQL